MKTEERYDMTASPPTATTVEPASSEMYEFLSVHTTIKLTTQVYIYVLFIITTCFDPCGSSSGDRINLSESNTIVTESFVRLTDMDPCECARRLCFKKLLLHSKVTDM
jgi:hypothetical protein